ncbi:AhpD family alkylhydroperoxidase [Pedobacter sp. UYP30]|uniref:carboxymuconolactone decarboxylase family protein n=1 Tax=Pedobacter sp. UYP30 TaxID=1756400 RepID=UPI00339309E2
MKTITVPSIEQVDPESQSMFEQMKKRMGKVPNLYATMGYSSHGLKGFIDFETALSKGVFTGKQREAIALTVSEINHCDYCLAGHTAMAVRNGLSIEDTLKIRSGGIEDKKLDAIIKLSKSIIDNKGHAEDQYLENFYSAGFDEGALMELIGFISLRIFTNYVFAATNIPIDYPLAPILTE